MEHKEHKSRRYFLTGFLIVVPLLVSIYLFLTLFLFFDNILGRYINGLVVENFGFRIRGLGILLFIVLIFATGFFATNFIGRGLMIYLERLWSRFPVVGKIYTAAKQVTRFLFSPSMTAGQTQKVALIEWPSKGFYTIGFVTKETDRYICDKAGRELINVLVPSVPNPVTGFLVFVPRENVIFLEMSVEEAIKIIVSGGVLGAKDVLQ